MKTITASVHYVVKTVVVHHIACKYWWLVAGRGDRVGRWACFIAQTWVTGNDPRRGDGESN